MTNDFVMSLPLGSEICVAVVLFGISWLPAVTIFRIAASPAPGARQASRASIPSSDRARPLTEPMSDRWLGQGVCHACNGLAGPDHASAPSRIAAHISP